MISPERERALEAAAEAARFALGAKQQAPKDSDLSMSLVDVRDALAALDALPAAPEDVGAGREERTWAQQIVASIENPDPNCPTMFTMDARVISYLRAIRDDLRALAASVKERR